MKKIAIFGSAFNPPSLGHKSVIERLTHFDEVLLVPSIAHAWGKTMLDYQQRCQLVDAFISDLGLSNVIRSDVEETLYKPGESVTTYSVLKKLQELNPESMLTFVLGPDNLFNFSKFYKSEAILEKWAVMACPETVKVRSTDIRNALNQDQPIDKFSTPNVIKVLQNTSWYSKM
ncbi:nicotinate-nicotinamide nucleotide adenylyltransferase [Vibrio maerlii]|uniref:nicotinate-nicotinamide nucleotide adenylyltransferase n=1 Tax=Vibrio maerlii TaxID=2231648 RepID=UPI000E3E63D2|nr:nicotinate-nicotinamide nucleotide adenylyltransferase [Vibrio maerlii]